MAELDSRKYTVVWLAPLEIEARAAMHMLDKRHNGHFPLERGKGTHLCCIGNNVDMCSTSAFSLLRAIPSEQEIYRTSNPA